MGNWVFQAGTEYGGTFNGASKLRWYDTVLTTAYAATANLLRYAGLANPITGGILANGTDLYLMPCDRLVSGEYQAGARRAWSNVDVEAFAYSSFATAATSKPVVFGASVYVVHSLTIQRVDPSGFVAIKSLYAHGAIVASSSKLFVFYPDPDTGLLAYISSSNGVSWSTPTLTALAVGPAQAALYGTTYGLVYGGGTSLSLFTSNGGTTWTGVVASPVISGANPFHGVWANALGAFAAVGTHLYKTTNGTSWTDLGEVLDGEVVNDIAFGNSMYMVVGAGGVAKTTTDFSTFTAFTGVDFAYHDIYAVTYTTEAISAASGTPITGFVRLDNSTGTLAARTVALYDYVTKELVDITVSNGSGVWTFSSVAPGQYFAVAIPEAADITAGRDFDALGIITVT